MPSSSYKITIDSLEPRSLHTVSVSAVTGAGEGKTSKITFQTGEGESLKKHDGCGLESTKFDVACTDCVYLIIMHNYKSVHMYTCNLSAAYSIVTVASGQTAGTSGSSLLYLLIGAAVAIVFILVFIVFLLGVIARKR